MLTADPDSTSPALPNLSDDEWDDPVLLEQQELERGGVVLPLKREIPLAATAPARKRGRVEMGLQISAKIRGGRSIRETDDPESGALSADVVKLECAPADQPFHANHVIKHREEPPLEPPKETGHQKEEHLEWGTKQRHPIRWLIGSALGVVLLLVIAVIVQALWLRDPPELPPEAVQLDRETPLDEVEGFELDGTSEHESRALFNVYAKANSPEDVLPLIRDREALEGKVRRDWRPWGTPPGWEGPFKAGWDIRHENGRGFGVLSGNLPDFKPFRAFFIREDGVLKLDWEASLGLGDSSFEMLQRGSGSGGIIRAYAKPDWYFSKVLPEDRYHCFKLIAPDQQEVIWAYTVLDSEADTGIMAFFPSGGVLVADYSELPVTLRLAPAPVGAQKNQWLITEMLHNEWVSP
ncbi:MAG: hypothetical protein K9N23_17100 [Akkermansiaceae bacterium]|nr:hypothetical protein [Akkermansiaceae bacterium]MCF7733411.1 hypothetical protein [Akkermansiaceae bacterium]